MERRITIRTGLLACLLVMTVMVGPLWAGGGQTGFEPLPDNAVVTGPEIWGVVTLYCNPSGGTFATIRLKRVVDCNVQTLTFVDLNWNLALCPESADSFNEGVVITNTDVKDALAAPEVDGGWNITTGSPFISKAKNFDRQPGDGLQVFITSFDALIKFYTVP